MVFRAVLIFLCLQITKAACRPVEDEAKAVNSTIDMARGEIHKALDNLTVHGLLPNIPCASLNLMEQQIHNISYYRCYIKQLSERIPELAVQLDACSQYLLDAEKLPSGQMHHVSCSLPSFELDHYNYVYAKCLLQLVNERLK